MAEASSRERPLFRAISPETAGAEIELATG
jgi:hypothetical protein